MVKVRDNSLLLKLAFFGLYGWDHDWKAIDKITKDPEYYLVWKHRPLNTCHLVQGLARVLPVAIWRYLFRGPLIFLRETFLLILMNIVYLCAFLLGYKTNLKLYWEECKSYGRFLKSGHIEQVDPDESSADITFGIYPKLITRTVILRPIYFLLLGIAIYLWNDCFNRIVEYGANETLVDFLFISSLVPLGLLSILMFCRAVYEFIYRPLKTIHDQRLSQRIDEHLARKSIAHSLRREVSDVLKTIHNKTCVQVEIVKTQE